MKSGFLILLLSLQLMVFAGTPLKELYKRGYINLEKKLDITNENLKSTSFVTNFNYFTVDREGTVFLVDYRGCRFFILNKDGSLNKVVGQKGKGPGDLMRPSRPVIFDDQLTIIEMTSRKASVFKKDGSFLRNIKHGKFLFIKHLIPLSKEKYLIYIYSMGSRKTMGKQWGTIYIYDKDFNELKQLYTRELKLNTYSARGNHPQPFAPEISCALNINNDIVLGFHGDEELTILRNKKKIKFRHNIKKRPVTEDDKAGFFGGMRFSTGKGTTTKVPEYFIKATVFPEMHPYFTRIVTDSEGNILLFSKENTFYSYDMNGKFISRVEIRNGKITPRNMKFNQNREFFTAIKDNENDDEPHLIKYQIK